MDDFIDDFGPVSAQDDFDLAALRYFEELDRQAGKRTMPAPRVEKAEPTAEEPGAPLGEPSADMDSLELQLMMATEDTPPKPRKPAPAEPKKPGKKPPLPRKTEETAKGEGAPLSELALEAAKLFQRLPAEDQLLAYTVMQKLARAAGVKG